MPGTSFIVLQAPKHLSIDAMPQSSREIRTELSVINGLSLDLPAQVASGTLFCQVLWGFANNNNDLLELRSLESVRLDLRREALSFRAQAIQSTAYRHAVEIRQNHSDLRNRALVAGGRSNLTTALYFEPADAALELERIRACTTQRVAVDVQRLIRVRLLGLLAPLIFITAEKRWCPETSPH